MIELSAKKPFEPDAENRFLPVSAHLTHAALGGAQNTRIYASAP
jgi:hypothetical protein